MELLAICKRTSGHRIAYIDLGRYLCEEKTDISFRDVAFKGE